MKYAKKEFIESMSTKLVIGKPITNEDIMRGILMILQTDMEDAPSTASNDSFDAKAVALAFYRSNKTSTDKEQQRATRELKKELSYMDYFTPVFASALTGAKVGDIMPAVLLSYENGNKRIPTGALNDLLQDAILNYQPPAKNGRRVKLNFITQASTLPPTFVVFVNDAKLINFSYERYLENRFRERIDFSGTPIKFVFKSKEEKW